MVIIIIIIIIIITQLWSSLMMLHYCSDKFGNACVNKLNISWPFIMINFMSLLFIITTINIVVVYMHIE